MLTGGAGGRALTRAFEVVFSVQDAFRNIPMAGRTDAWILADALAAHGIPWRAADVAFFRDCYFRYLAEEMEKPGPRKGVMPGVRPLIERLMKFAGQGDVYLALLTGNYEEGARVKLAYFDLWRHFQCGAFGDDAPDRNGLLAKAIVRVSDCGGPSFAPGDAVVIGDTPLDVECARSGGARSIAVATGSHSFEQLHDAGADLVLRDLSDTKAVLRALGLTP